MIPKLRYLVLKLPLRMNTWIVLLEMKGNCTGILHGAVCSFNLNMDSSWYDAQKVLYKKNFIIGTKVYYNSHGSAPSLNATNSYAKIP